MDHCKCCKETAKELHKTLLLLVAERQKTELFKQMIEQRYNLTINFDGSINDMITTINDRVFNFNERAIAEPRLDQRLEQRQQTTAEDRKQAVLKQKKVFKPAPKSMVSDEEENHENTKEVEEKINMENIRLFGEYDISLNNDKIENNIQQLKATKTTKDCTAILTEIRTQRQLVQLTLSPSDYGTFLIEHIERIKRILTENEHISKKLEPKKMTSLLSRILTTLEQRIIFHQGFQNQTLDADEIARYRQCLVLSAKHPKTYRTFVFESFYDYFTNFSLALFPLYDIFEIYVANPYGFKNLCFSSFGADKSESDFTFYHLEKYDGVSRYWTMDSRLESTCMKLSEIVRVYCASLFRKIYKSCFNTNDYIEGYRSKYAVLEFDCEQLLRNILLTVNTGSFIKGICGIVKRCCTINPTINDKFSSHSDNEEQAISFKRYELNDTDIVAVVETIFDNIKESQCIDIYKNFLKTQ